MTKDMLQRWLLDVDVADAQGQREEIRLQVSSLVGNDYEFKYDAHA